jgi:hypothetical protein
VGIYHQHSGTVAAMTATPAGRYSDGVTAAQPARSDKYGRFSQRRQELAAYLMISKPRVHLPSMT